MALFKCKMCGGSLEIGEGLTVIECEYCGTQQTLPKLDDDKRANMYDRANHFRRNNEFDKAMSVYEKILNEDNTDAEAYWSLILCRYGIEYVEDPTTHKRIPTVNRAQFTSIFDDDNYKSALQYADMRQRLIYEEEAKAINEIQKGILAISQKEEPFDVFICYKETDANGKRTQDSVLAQDLYYQLKQEGFKVFFARITLENKLGSAYEPYIFAALNSAKVMVVLGTKQEYFNAVWVKNEWSRYLALVKHSKGKKMLIPAYRDMDPYNLPEEFSHLQAQDMSKLGFMQDLIRGIKKIVKSDEPKTTIVKETVVTSSSANTAPLIKRVFMFLEDSKWSEANEYCEKVLDIDPECADAYLGKLLAELKVKRKSLLELHSSPFDNSDNYEKIMRFGSEDLVSALKQYNVVIRNRNEKFRLEGIYNTGVDLAKLPIPDDLIAAAEEFEKIPGYRDAEARAKKCRHKALLLKYDIAMDAMKKSVTSQEFAAVSKKFLAISDYPPAKEKAEECIAKSKERAEWERQIDIYDEALEAMEKDEISSIESAIKKFQSIIEWEDSKAKIAECHKKIAAIKYKLEQQRIANEKAVKKRKKIKVIVVSCVCVFIALIIVLNSVIPKVKYNHEVSLYGEKYANTNIGDYMYFGAYEQDNNTSNGKEEIQWLVLDKQDGKVLVISRYALDCQPYNTSNTDVTWETCSLRKWLNTTFINNAFSAEEQAFIPTVTVSANKNSRNFKYDTNPGNATQDKIFLLSVTEVNKYFKSDDVRMCGTTEYTKEQGAWTSFGYSADGKATCDWWLRSPGYDQDEVFYVYRSGDETFANNVDDDNTAVRPALWITLDS